MRAGSLWWGPLQSGALLLLWPTGESPSSHDLPATFEPRHEGGVDTSTGLYVREDDDLHLAGTPPFILTRTYRTKDRVSRHFGIGATNNAEWYLMGDGRTFQWVALILEDGTRVHFDRVSEGTSYSNARYVNDGAANEFDWAEVGWTGRRWLLRYYDGSLAWFRGCSPATRQPCGIIQTRDFDGHVVHFDRNAEGNVETIRAGRSQSMHFEYDDRQRIIRARTSDAQQVVYTYDDGGRLREATAADGVKRSYTYGAQDELLTITEPGRVITNEYDSDLRVSRQVTQSRPSPAGPSDPYVLEFRYRTGDDGVVTETDVTEPDGTHTLYRFANGRAVLEIYDAQGDNPVMVSLDRDESGFVTRVTVRCRANGRRITRTADITADDDEETIKRQLIADECSEGRAVPRPPERPMK